MKIQLTGGRAVAAIVAVVAVAGFNLLRPVLASRSDAETTLRRWLKSHYVQTGMDAFKAAQNDPEGQAGRDFERRMENLGKIEFPVVELRRAWMKPPRTHAAAMVKVQISFGGGPPPDGKTTRYFLLRQGYWGGDWEVHREVSEREFRWGIG